MGFNYKDYENLIYKIIYSFTKEKNLVEDLYQQGIIGLINAWNHYDQNSAVKFSTFAYNYIFGEIYNYYNRSNHMFKINSNHLKAYKEIQRAKEYLTQEYKKEPTTREIAVYLNTDEETVLNIILLMQQGLSINYEVDNQELGDRIKSSDNYEVINITELLESLPDEQRIVLEYKYLCGFSQEEIARIMNTSQSSVSRNEKSGLSRIRVKETSNVYN